MDVWAQWGFSLIKGLPFLLTHPFTYLLLLIIALEWRRQMNMQRKLFGTRLHTVTEGMLHSLYYGIGGGFLVSVLLIGFGVVLSPEAFLYLWVIALVLSCIRVRYLCFAYAGAVLAVFVLAARFFPLVSDIEWLQGIGSTLAGIYLPALFALVALLHVVEAVLIRFGGAKRGTPVFILGKRGRLVGGYQMQHIWFVPLVLVIEGGQAALSPLFGGWPLFVSEQTLPLSLLVLPAALGYSEQVISSTPKQKARFSAQWLVVYSIFLFLLSLASVYVNELIFVTILFSFLGHEALVWFSRYKEQKQAPVFVHPASGLKILAIIPHSPADKMGLRSGEVILKANGLPVRKRKDLYEALSKNKTFSKLEVQDIYGESKFVNRSLYEDEHHLLGILLAPDEDEPYYLEPQNVHLWRLIVPRIRKKPAHPELTGNNGTREPTTSEAIFSAHTSPENILPEDVSSKRSEDM